MNQFFHFITRRREVPNCFVGRVARGDAVQMSDEASTSCTPESRFCVDLWRV